MKVELTLTGATNPTVSITDLPYDKQKGFTFKKALGYASDYTVCFKILNGGVSNGVTYPGFTYTDGTGKLIKYKASTGICNEGRTANPALVNNAQLLEIANADWGIINHGYQHGDGIPLNDLHQNDVTLFQDIGYRCDAIQIPNADPGYVDTGLILGYKQINSEFAPSAQDGNNDVVPTNMSWNGVVNLAANSTQNLDKILASQWFLNDNWPDSQLQYNKDLVDTFFSKTGGKWIGQTLSHGPFDSAEPAENFNALMQYIKNHPLNNDSAWICSTKEVLDYLDMRRNAGIIQSFNSTTNVLTLEIDLADINPDTFIRNLSFRLSSGTITGATIVNGLDEVTFNGTLLNLYKRDKSTYRNPNTLVLPPQIVGVQYNGTAINITYDKPITQTLKEGFEVSNNTVNSIIGSGVNWTVNLQNPITTGQTYSYIVHKGNARLSGSSTESMKVPSYIAQGEQEYTAPPEPTTFPIYKQFRIS